MTNAYVENIVAGKDGETLMVKNKDGEKKIVVTPQTVIAAAAPGRKEELKAGAQHHYHSARKSRRTARCWRRVMYVGRGVTPAM